MHLSTAFNNRILCMFVYQLWGILPPIENIGNTGGMVAAGGISPALASRVDPTGFWSAGFSDGDGTGYFASQFSANPANVGSVMGLGEQGMFPPIAGMPGAGKQKFCFFPPWTLL